MIRISKLVLWRAEVVHVDGTSSGTCMCGALCYPLTHFFQHCDWNASISGQHVNEKKRGRLSGANLNLKNKLLTFHRPNALVKNWSIQSASWYQITFPFIYARANWEAMHWKLYSCGYRSLEVKGNLLGLIASEISYHAHEILSLLFSTSSWLSGFSTSCHWKVCSTEWWSTVLVAIHNCMHVFHLTTFHLWKPIIVLNYDVRPHVSMCFTKLFQNPCCYCSSICCWVWPAALIGMYMHLYIHSWQ